MKTSDFDYHLPPELIAQEPAPEREQARLMVLDRHTGAIRHQHVFDLPQILQPGDLLVLNDTRVFPARLIGCKTLTGGRVEILLLEETSPDQWEALWQASRAPRIGSILEFAAGLIQATVIDRPRANVLRLNLSYRGCLMDILKTHGQTPLPPYIKRITADLTPERVAQDRARYQTVYARATGAIAAPTAGLHFTHSLFAKLKARGINTTTITLHVGPGTFRPVQCENVQDHYMDAERYIISTGAADAINATRQAGHRVIAVGSTTVRALETMAANNTSDATCRAGSGYSTLFIRPPYRFRLINAMLTNFHLPRSTLLMMVSALADIKTIRQAYAIAVAEQYRFFSFGDCMLIE